MFEAFLFILLGTWCTVSSSQPVLTQESSMSASPGQTVKLSCSMSSGYPVQNDDQSWYQQKPGSPPKFLVYYYSSPQTGSGNLSRFSSSKESSRNTWYLTISNVQAEDEGDYYCVVQYETPYTWIFGGGTQLTVSGGPRSPPTVNLYCPPKEQMASEGKATLVCSITDFSPSPMETTWEVGGTAVSNGVQTTKPIKDNGKYMTSSYMTTTASDWERGDSFTCKVRHEGIDYVKTVSQSQCP